ncbi:hypothetical protein MPLSOD_90065 [Mesorhizobium sp. SOD10]|nr:hypothetical protein MPLSOD_90065 [Mesorhizobium sp. SOD10]
MDAGNCGYFPSPKDVDFAQRRRRSRLRGPVEEHLSWPSSNTNERCVAKRTANDIGNALAYREDLMVNVDRHKMPGAEPDVRARRFGAARKKIGNCTLAKRATVPAFDHRHLAVHRNRMETAIAGSLRESAETFELPRRLRRRKEQRHLGRS